MIVGLDAERAPNESITSRVNLDLTLRQAHVNLLKACWILYDVVLSDEGMVLSLTDENRAMFLTLEKASNHYGGIYVKMLTLPRLLLRIMKNFEVLRKQILARKNYYSRALLYGNTFNRWKNVWMAFSKT